MQPEKRSGIVLSHDIFQKRNYANNEESLRLPDYFSLTDSILLRALKIITGF